MRFQTKSFEFSKQLTYKFVIGSCQNQFLKVFFNSFFLHHKNSISTICSLRRLHRNHQNKLPTAFAIKSKRNVFKTKEILVSNFPPVQLFRFPMKAFATLKAVKCAGDINFTVLPCSLPSPPPPFALHL